MPGTPPTTSPDLLPRIGDADSPDIPRDMNALADATQVALSKIRATVPAIQARYYASSVRPADASAGVGGVVPLTAALVINSAPPGVYMITTAGAMKSLPVGAGTVLTVIFNVNGTNIVAVPREVNQAYWQDVAYSVTYVKTTAASTLTVNISVTSNLTTFQVKGGSAASVVRVSP